LNARLVLERKYHPQRIDVEHGDLLHDVAVRITRILRLRHTLITEPLPRHCQSDSEAVEENAHANRPDAQSPGRYDDVSPSIMQGNAMRWLLLLLAGMLFVACGSDNGTSASATQSIPGTPSLTSAPATTAGDSTATPAKGSSSAESSNPASSVLVNAGDLGQFDDPGVCGGGVSGDALQFITTTYRDDDSTWILQFYVSRFDGPGTYEAGNLGSSYDTSVSFGDGSGSVWSSSKDLGGTVIVSIGGDSGSIDVVVETDDDKPNVHITGSWSCDVL
jgi:hypothetical protein